MRYNCREEKTGKVVYNGATFFNFVETLKKKLIWRTTILAGLCQELVTRPLSSGQ